MNPLKGLATWSCGFAKLKVVPVLLLATGPVGGGPAGVVDMLPNMYPLLGFVAAGVVFPS